MQAVILSAGKGTRMGALTAQTPKPMLTVSGKTLLEHKFDALPDEVDEIVLVIGHLGDVIRARYGDAYGNRKITYIEQEDANGTGSAVWLTKDVIRDRFIVMMGDDIYSREDIEKCIAAAGWTLVVSHVPAGSGGKVVTDASGAITDVMEGSHAEPEGFFIGTNLFALDARVFAQELVPAGNGKPEFGLPQTVLAASKAQGIPLMPIEATSWIQVTAPEDIPKAEAILAAR